MPDKSPRSIRALFERTVPRYDLLNRVLSLGQDVRWRARAARGLTGRVLDLGTGTGDMAAACLEARAVVGIDFTPPMLRAARRRHGRIALAAADAVALPFRDATFDAATAAFVVRSYPDLARGLREVRRVLRPGGRLVVLEFVRPEGPWAPAARAYVSRVVPFLGRVLSPGSGGAYRYLRDSLLAFHTLPGLAAEIERAGFRCETRDALTGGAVGLVVARAV